MQWLWLLQSAILRCMFWGKCWKIDYMKDVWISVPQFRLLGLENYWFKRVTADVPTYHAKSFILYELRNLTSDRRARIATNLPPIPFQQVCSFDAISFTLVGRSRFLAYRRSIKKNPTQAYVFVWIMCPIAKSHARTSDVYLAIFENPKFSFFSENFTSMYVTWRQT